MVGGSSFEGTEGYYAAYTINYVAVLLGLPFYITVPVVQRQCITYGGLFTEEDVIIDIGRPRPSFI